jgi:hypothetical protein
MNCFAAILDLWPSGADLARDIGVETYLPRMWRHRGVIPPRYWPVIVDCARRRGFDGVSVEILSAAYADALAAPPIVEAELSE